MFHKDGLVYDEPGMPNLKPLTKLVTKARDLRDHHRERHRPSGFPDPMRVWIRHRIPMLNLIVHGLLHTIDDHEEPPERNPFK